MRGEYNPINEDSNSSVEEILNSSNGPFKQTNQQKMINISKQSDSLFGIKDSMTFTFNNNMNETKLRSYEIKKKLLEERVNKFKNNIHKDSD